MEVIKKKHDYEKKKKIHLKKDIYGYKNIFYTLKRVDSDRSERDMILLPPSFFYDLYYQ